MTWLFWLLLGLFAGASVGLLVSAMLITARLSDEASKRRSTYRDGRHE